VTDATDSTRDTYGLISRGARASRSDLHESNMRLLAILIVSVLITLPTAAQETDRPGSIRSTYRFDPSQSLLVSTMLRSEEPPPARSLRIVHLLHKDVPNAPIGLVRTREEALAIAEELTARGRGGESMETIARRYSAARNAVTGGVLGTFAKGILASEFDAFLFTADVGDISEAIELPTGVFVLERVERWAASRTIMVSGSDDAARERMAAIEARLEAGESFADVAGELSEDEVTRVRDGALAIFERGPEDRLLKAATFNAAVGEVVGPIESPLGLHLIKRVPLDSVPETVRERNWARLSAIVLIQSDTTLPIPSGDRNSVETAALADELYGLLSEGASFEQLARAYNDDFADGAERAGDLGWIHARQPGLSPALRMTFQLKVGEIMEPQPTNFGWLILRRDA
jgi:parvulin-like peptidyl-prolyl isomerase